MKKHPVDELFASKLTKWEPEASPDLWKRIEASQQKTTRRLGGWFWFAAAGVSIALLTGYLVWQGESLHPNNTEQTVAQQVPTPSSKGKNNKLVVPEQTPELVAEVEVLDKRRNVSKETITADPLKTKPMEGKKNEASQKDPVSVMERIEIAAIPREEAKPVLETGENEQLAVTTPVEVPAPGDQDKKPSKTRVIIAHIPTEEPSAQDEQKSSKLLRVLRQLKNAKEGEAVDWDVVGFNPKKLMARADQRLKTEEEKISKQYQNLKEKTKL